MKRFPATKARLVLRALLRIGWVIIRQVGSHRILAKEGYENYTFSFHDSDELGHYILKDISKETGLQPEDL
jgi:predicted RNA binding protein YcfA (HicA-like mRNA interferase family)